ncbi:MAG: hypothetical protein QF732_00505 [Nitrospinaceae bacterium]|jgi:hypothetical protein|nr:hypothetical protein [Nitrospinaceae bacterium]MDP7011929.1 hypothetical protein [Verrucomicrobiota bacterium]
MKTRREFLITTAVAIDYNSESQRIIGERFAQCYFKLKARKQKSKQPVSQ